MSASRRESNDALAREAARLLAEGRADDIEQALTLARRATGEIGQPSRMLVRKHAQAMSMQALGEAEYQQRTRDLLAIAEEIMTAIEQAFPDASTRLVGRAAEAHFDADPSMHIRVLIHESTAEIAAALDRLGYHDADFTFTTLEAVHVGRLSQVEWRESDAHVVLTRCPTRAILDIRTDLVTGKPLPSLTLHALRERLGEAT